VDRPGATPRAASCLSFFFARLWHIILRLLLILTLSEIGRTPMSSPGLSQPLSPSPNVPLSMDPRPQSTGIPYRRSSFGRASLPLFLSPTMFITAAPPRVLLTFALAPFHWYDYTFVFISHWSHLILLYNFYCILDYKDVPVCGLTIHLHSLFYSPCVRVIPPLVFSSFPSLSSLAQVSPVLPAFHSFGRHSTHVHNRLPPSL
jgi:hypothetical protein